MTKLIFATGNKGKIREAREILHSGFEIISSAEAGVFDEPEENGETLKENSILKARFIHSRTGCDCFADDSGLEVDALGGAPGVHAARFAMDIALRDGLDPEGLSHDFGANIDALLRELEKHPDEPRTARFKTVVTLILAGRELYFEGVMEGSIAYGKSGYEGFGYDPVFVPSREALTSAGLSFPEGTTFASMGEEVKNLISHRGQALRAMAAYLEKL